MVRRFIASWLCGVALWGGSLAAQPAWQDPQQASFPVVQGQGCQPQLRGSYNRLPERFQAEVRAGLWHLSHHSAGLYVDFQSDAPEIHLRYGIVGSPAMSHMAATGVSGMDLYVRSADSSWHFVSKSFDDPFADTVHYTFRPYLTTGGMHHYRLYLPLYNQVSWMNVGVDPSMQLAWIPRSEALPIVAYGTSILQGGCASRPGMAWANILARKLDLPLINLGFSGNGQMDSVLLDLMAHTPARIYLIDCLPNLVGMEDAVVEQKYLKGVRQLRAQGNQTPILLVEHAGGGEKESKESEGKNSVLRRCYEQLKREGVKQLYYMTRKEIALSSEATVDGTHPTDWGMQTIAEAYARKVQKILK
ncbi:MAG: SGNH/GDSL hydrolase family protein [Alistipes sp.]|nr:SGNH/GDSL hydrolase family protein [Alistipes sp.]